MLKNTIKTGFLGKKIIFFAATCFWAGLWFSNEGLAQTKQTPDTSQHHVLKAPPKGETADDDKLLEEFVKAKGGDIIFDASNIKQYWIDNSVASMNGVIMIALKDNQTSVPLKIQLANVFPWQDCRVDVVAKNSDFSFSVLDSKQSKISASSSENNFINYSVQSSSYQIEKTDDKSIFLTFRSNNDDMLSIKKIVMSFSRNNDFLSSPGNLSITRENVSGSFSADTSDFVVEGKNSAIMSTKRIMVSGNTLSSSVKVKNVGNNPACVDVGYAPFFKNGKPIDSRVNPYKNNKVLNVVSAEKGSDKILVDSYPEWEKGCVVALNAKEDLSDFPNCSYLDGEIVEITQKDENLSEITLSKPLSDTIKKGTPVRIQSPRKTYYLYTSRKVLQPGEEAVYTSSIKKDDELLQFSHQAFCRGTSYVQPLILYRSSDLKSAVLVQIDDYSIEY